MVKLKCCEFLDQTEYSELPSGQLLLTMLPFFLGFIGFSLKLPIDKERSNERVLIQNEDLTAT